MPKYLNIEALLLFYYLSVLKYNTFVCIKVHVMLFPWLKEFPYCAQYFMQKYLTSTKYQTFLERFE